MIQSLKAINFQSLQDVEVEFGKFTVIVGASSSGKSALTRAMKAVTSNALDSDNITRGAKHSAVSLKTEETTVTIERESNGSSYYKITSPSGKESTFTKLNRSVPAEVTAALGIAPSTQEVSSINFAGQFDTPYLLKDGASSVARILGELTNVSTIFSAVREASKRAKNASALVNLRKKDLDKVVTQITNYSSIGLQAKRITSVEDRLAVCLEKQVQVNQLRDLLDRAAAASQALSGIKEIKTLPDLAHLVNAQTNLTNFKHILREAVLSQQTLNEQSAKIKSADDTILSADKELHQTLADAGQCPTCNQPILE